MNAIERAREAKDDGAHLLERGKPEAALKEFLKAVELCPDDVAARKKAADILVKLGRKAQAVGHYQHLAGRYAADGQLAQAIAVSKMILQLDPRHTETQETLARLYSRKTGGGGTWLEKIPPNMAGALNLRHVKADAQPAAPAAAAQPAVAEAPAAPAPATVEVEVEIDVSALPKAPLFSELPQEIFLALVQDVAMRNVPAGEAIVREGDPGRSMFVLTQGSVKIVRALGKPEEKTVAEMGEGTFFGEIGLLSDVPRLASVVAANECVVLEVTREMLAGLSAKHAELDAVLQRFYRERLLANLLRSNAIFADFDEPARKGLADKFALRRAERGHKLVVEGMPGQALFVLLRGRCEAFHRDSKGKEHSFPPMTEGAVFGEIALMGEGVATATVRASEGCLLLALDRETFKSKVLSNPKAKEALEKLRTERLQRTADLGTKLGELASFI